MTSRAALLYGALLIVAAAAGIRWETGREPVYAFDGYNYAVRAQVDAGIPYGRALANARVVYRDKPAIGTPVARVWYDAPQPQYWRLFASRALYPWLASRLWPLFGFDSLFVVANVSYVAGVALLFALLLRFAPAPAAALVTAAIAALPEVRLLGRSDLTDATAWALWCAVLLWFVRFVEQGRRSDALLYACSTLAMTFTRPFAYAPLCCGVAVVLFGLLARANAIARRGVVAAAIALACAGLGIVAAELTRAPSFLAVLSQLHDDTPLRALSLSQWYARQEARTLVEAVTELLSLPLAWLGLAGLMCNWRRPAVAGLGGGLAAGIVTLALNPIPSDVARVIVLPMLPLLGAGATMLAGRTIARRATVAIPAVAKIANGSIDVIRSWERR
ncbi:MAG: glycosyltransferase family 39 protein [Candidatus Eremiobacteraeota bacterium]|nr:glycosyltransferase family 39 protein [Candidatus Eremiobacteraeota bacterium]